MKNSQYKNILVKRISLEAVGQYLGLIILNRPEQMNPYNWATVKELRMAIEGLATERNVRVVAVTGAGKAFCAGGDLEGYLTLMRNEKDFRGFLYDLRTLFTFMSLMEQPVIALVNGYCVAGGLELLMACDFAYAAESAKIGDGHVNFGQYGSSQIRLPRLILPQRARELLYTGRLLTANEALEWGLVNRVVPDDKLLNTGIELANEIATKSPVLMGLVKELTTRGLEMGLDSGLQLEIERVSHYSLTSYDSREGLEAFSERRKPKFEGR